VQRDRLNSIKETVSRWQVRVLPGIVVIGLVVAARLTGSFQGLELLAFDTFLRLRSAEPQDDRIVLVGIDEADMQRTGYPIPDRELVDLVEKLQTYKPTVIGLNIQQNQIERSDNLELFESLNRYQNLVVVDRIIPASDQIPPPLELPANQVGFADILPDGDNHLRRVLLGARNPVNLSDYKYSLAIRLVQPYLQQNRSIILENGIHDPLAMRFGKTELPRLLPNSGGYIGADTGGPQILLNYRIGQKPFRTLSFNQIRRGEFDPSWLRDRIVIVGITNPKIRPAIPTATLPETNSLDIQAHAVSQIISAVFDGRPLLKTWTDLHEYWWIIVWGGIAILLGQSNFLPRIKLAAIGFVTVGLILGSYLLVIGGWWIPVIPAAFVWLLNGLGYTAFYKYDWVLRSRLKENQRIIEERQRTIEQTFNVIHNGPLQTLANLLRQLRDSGVPTEKLVLALENLNLEIRNIGEHLKHETLSQEESLYLRDGLKVDLKLPIHELFYEVYSTTIERADFPRFKTLKISCYFEPIDQEDLSIETRRDLSRFLEEALCNVGKHADAATCLNVTSTYNEGWYIIRITDNGVGIRSSREGQGTKHARKLAVRLGGRFKREQISPKGTLCELTLSLS
jgi:CHASE2 domain-containing sensor protein/DNA-binding transcriptional ArsR family regulator